LVDSSISRAASVVVVTRSAICSKVAATSLNWRRPASTALEPVSVAMTVVLTAPRTSSMSPRISFADPETRSASLRISSATTANRRPESPALVASIVALMARMLVCSASSETMSRTAPICCDLSPSSSMCRTMRSTCPRIASIDEFACSIVLSPARAALTASAAICATRWALSEICREVASSSLIVVVISLIAVASSLAPVAC
jgi:hypothetical protein